MSTDTPGTPTSDRTRVRRLPDRGRYDVESVHAILDAGIVCHVGYSVDGQPYVTPTTYWREDDHVYWHGSSASRMLRNLADGVACCFTVTLIDGLVLARSGFHHSANYRSVMALGTAELVDGEAEKSRVLARFVERLFPGRWDELRPMTSQELKGTTVLRLPLDEASAKVRSGPPKDDEEDYGVPVWAGVLPLTLDAGTPLPDPRLLDGLPLPAYLRNYLLER